MQNCSPFLRKGPVKKVGISKSGKEVSGRAENLQSGVTFCALSDGIFSFQSQKIFGNFVGWWSHGRSFKISGHPHPTICLLRWWVSECQSTSIRRDAAGIVRRNERMKEIEGGRRPTKRRRETVQSRKRWTDKSSSNMSKCGELSPQSNQLARKEWLFCSTR